MQRPHMRELKRTFLDRSSRTTSSRSCTATSWSSVELRSGHVRGRARLVLPAGSVCVFCLFRDTHRRRAASLTIEDRKHIHADHYPRHCPTGWEQFRDVPPINSGAFLADVGTMLEIVRKSDASSRLAVLATTRGPSRSSLFESAGPRRVFIDHRIRLDLRDDLQLVRCGLRYVRSAGESGMVYPVSAPVRPVWELQRDLNRRMPLDPQLLVATRSFPADVQRSSGG